MAVGGSGGRDVDSADADAGAQCRGVAPDIETPPRIILTGGTWFGDVKILHERMWERLPNRR